MVSAKVLHALRGLLIAWRSALAYSGMVARLVRGWRACHGNVRCSLEISVGPKTRPLTGRVGTGRRNVTCRDVNGAWRFRGLLEANQEAHSLSRPFFVRFV